MRSSTANMKKVIIFALIFGWDIIRKKIFFKVLLTQNGTYSHNMILSFYSHVLFQSLSMHVCERERQVREGRDYFQCLISRKWSWTWSPHLTQICILLSRGERYMVHPGVQSSRLIIMFFLRDQLILNRLNTQCLSTMNSQLLIISNNIVNLVKDCFIKTSFIQPFLEKYSHSFSFLFY